MPYLTMRKNLKLQLSHGLVASYNIQPGNGVGLFWDTKRTHIFTYLLTLPRPKWGTLNSLLCANDLFHMPQPTVPWPLKGQDVASCTWHNAILHQVTAPVCQMH